MENEMQFERAEFAGAGVGKCSACQQPLAGEYFEAGGQVLCRNCAEQVRGLASAKIDPNRLMLAVLFGFGAALLGGGIYGAVMIFAHSEWALISIGVGILVGKAVRIGSGDRGGRVYQILAAVLTYVAIAGAYAASVYREIPGASPAIIPRLAAMAYRLPFMGGAENILGLLIIAFGVWQAWKINHGIQVDITGPHAVSTAPPAAPLAGA